MNFKFNRTLLTMLAWSMLTLSSCKKDNHPVPVPPVTIVFAKGADVSWLPQMEVNGRKFYDLDGTEKNAITQKQGNRCHPSSCICKSFR